MALVNIGKKVIRSFDQGGNEAKICKQEYDVARLITLEGALWNFASGWKAGVRLGIDPKPGWAYVYSYPNEALKVFRIIPDDRKSRSPIPFEVTDRMDAPGKIIHTDHEAPCFEFTRDKEDVSTFSWEFIQAFSWQLSKRICMPLTKNPKMLEKCEINADLYTAVAEASSANESDETQDGMAKYHEVRDD